MQNVTVPSEYLLRDPKEFDSLKPGHTSETTRSIDSETLLELVYICLGIQEGLIDMLRTGVVYGRVRGVENFEVIYDKLHNHNSAFIRIVNEVAGGMKL